MGGDFQGANFGSVTDTYSAVELGLDTSDQIHLRKKFSGGYAGMMRPDNDRLYRLVKAGSTITAGQFVKPDTAGADPFAVIPTAAAGDGWIGVCETAIASGEYGWMTCWGQATATILTATTKGQLLSASSTAGVGGAASASRQRMLIPHMFADGGTVADGTVYRGFLCPGFACTVKGISLIAAQPSVGGTNTFKALKGSSSGNTMLSAASYDPTGLTANQGALMSLTSTAADLQLAASGAGSGIYLEYNAGTQTTDATQVGVLVEVEPTTPDNRRVGAIALEDGAATNAAKRIFIFGG